MTVRTLATEALWRLTGLALIVLVALVWGATSVAGVAARPFTRTLPR